MTKDEMIDALEGKLSSYKRKLNTEFNPLIKQIVEGQIKNIEKTLLAFKNDEIEWPPKPKK